MTKKYDTPESWGEDYRTVWTRLQETQREKTEYRVRYHKMKDERDLLIAENGNFVDTLTEIRDNPHCNPAALAEAVLVRKPVRPHNDCEVHWHLMPDGECTCKSTASNRPATSLQDFAEAFNESMERVKK